MSTHRLTAKQIISRVRELFPKIQETYALQLINDALTELGKYNVKYERAKADSVSGKAWYTINDVNSGIEVNKIFKVSFLDNDDKYKRIPRLLANEVDIEDLA